MVHQDLKPDNILISLQQGSIKLADYGMTGLYQYDEGEYKVRGTVPYMSPEVYQKLMATIASDLWALGIIGYELLELVRPFQPFDREGDLARQLRHNIVKVEPRLVNTCVSQQFVNLIMLLLQKAPFERLSSSDLSICDLIKPFRGKMN